MRNKKVVARAGFLFFVILFSAILCGQALLAAGIVKITAKTTGLRLSIERLNLDILHSRIYIRNVTLFNPADFSAQQVLSSAGEICIQYNLFNWITGTAPLEYVTADIRELNIIRNKEGRLNISGFRKDNAEFKNKKGYPEPCAMPVSGHTAENVVYGEHSCGIVEPPGQAMNTPAGSKNGRRPVIKRLEICLKTARFIDYQTRDNTAREIIFTAGRPCIFKNVGNLGYVFDALLTSDIALAPGK